jgi:hypothetical protein
MGMALPVEKSGRFVAAARNGRSERIGLTYLPRRIF